MAVAQMTPNFQAAIKLLTEQTTEICVKVLAEQYDFDPAEGMRFLATSVDPKSVKGSAAKSKGKVKTTVVKATGDVPKPKRPLTGYQLFQKEMRPKAAADLALGLGLEEGEKPKPSVVMTEMGARWRALSKEDQETWKDKAKTPPASSSEESE